MESKLNLMIASNKFTTPEGGYPILAPDKNPGFKYMKSTVLAGLLPLSGNNHDKTMQSTLISNS